MIRKSYVDTADGQLHYRYTDSGTGDPLVFLHMTAASSAAFEPIMKELEGTIPMIAFDTVNYGESFRTDHEPDIDYMASLKLEALTNLGITKFHTFGHHTGSVVQTSMAVQAPDRVLSAVLNGASYADMSVYAAFRDELALPNPITLRGTQFMWAWSRIKDVAQLPHGNVRMPRAAEVMHRDTVDMLRAGENWHWGYLAVFSYDFKSNIHKISCPMFFVSGEQDVTWPRHKAAQEAFPHMRSHQNPDGGAYYVETHPEVLAPLLLSFLEDEGFRKPAADAAAV